MYNALMSFTKENKIFETLEFIRSDIENKLFSLSSRDLDSKNFLPKDFFDDIVLKIAPKDKILHLLNTLEECELKGNFIDYEIEKLKVALDVLNLMKVLIDRGYENVIINLLFN